MNWNLALMLLALFWSCGKSSGSSDKSEDDGSTDEEAGGVDPTEDNGGLCSTMVAESFPEQVTMTCTLPDGTTLTEYKLELTPEVDTLKVLLDGTEIDKARYTYHSDTGYLQISEAFAETVVKILYTKKQ